MVRKFVALLVVVFVVCVDDDVSPALVDQQKVIAVLE